MYKETPTHPHPKNVFIAPQKSPSSKAKLDKLTQLVNSEGEGGLQSEVSGQIGERGGG